ncbi:hypothetical protein MHH42_28190 [Bacillus sp. FSL L8-0099]|uniref:hypothetical protein n=1 Tax=Bacillus sp. FSL L8-0099 TaxID=2921514 RepID=UPI0015D51728|nr:hypothetical protein [Bacillus toyonensis]
MDIKLAPLLVKKGYLLEIKFKRQLLHRMKLLGGYSNSEINLNPSFRQIVFEAGLSTEGKA